VAIKSLSDPAVRVLNADGTTPDGLPYFDFTDKLPNNTLLPGNVSQSRTLQFSNPNKGRFTYDLVVLGQLNRPPVITSSENAEALPGVPYVYAAAATDPDGDPLTFSLPIGPAGMEVDRTTGQVTWSPGTADGGTANVVLRVTDGRGGTAEQSYTVTV